MRLTTIYVLVTRGLDLDAWERDSLLALRTYFLDFWPHRALSEAEFNAIYNALLVGLEGGNPSPWLLTPPEITFAKYAQEIALEHESYLLELGRLDIPLDPAAARHSWRLYRCFSYYLLKRGRVQDKEAIREAKILTGSLGALVMKKEEAIRAQAAAIRSREKN